MTARPPTQDDAYLTETFGPKCPDCGWRSGRHKPGGPFLGEPCHRWTAEGEEGR